MVTTFEREIKLRFNSPSAAREAVAALGAAPLAARRLQRDALLDTPDGLLRSQSLILRVRVEPDRGIATVKGPALPSAMKVREEIETSVGDGEVFLRMLERIGFRVWFRYEKYREEFTVEGVIVAIDETPLGTFIELEGDEQRIGSTTVRLGRSPEDYVLDSYRALFLLDCERRGIAPGDMVFGAD